MVIHGKTRLGISLTAEGGEAALMRLRGKRRKPKLLAEARSEIALGRFAPLDFTNLATVFKDLVKGLPKGVRRADLPVLVSIPDALVREDVLQFSDFPADKKVAHDLLRMRMLRDGDGSLHDPICTFEIVNRTDFVTVRVRSLERALRDAIEDAAHTAGIHITVLDGWFRYASTALDGLSDDGACFLSDGQSWSLVCWSSDSPEGFYESGWVPRPPEALKGRAARLMQSFALRNRTKAMTFVADAPDLILPRLPAGIFAKTLTCQEAFGSRITLARGVAQWG